MGAAMSLCVSVLLPQSLAEGCDRVDAQQIFIEFMKKKIIILDLLVLILVTILNTSGGGRMKIIIGILESPR
jgi:hypothetical protein